MPYKDSNAARLAAREKQRRYRANKKKKAAPTVSPAAERVDADRLAEWSRSTLKVPPGHPLAGQPLELPPYGVDFLRDALAVPESLLCVARKNAKSAIIAVLLLARLGGPLRFQGYRGGVCSVNREKAGELWLQCEGIIEASELPGIIARKSPRHLLSDTGRVDFLSADASAGHSSGFDDAVFDELGLLKERDRELVNGLRTSVSARNGRFIGLSIQGDAPFTEEMLARRGAAGLTVHHYAAPEDCSLDDEDAWRAANPGLDLGIKSMDYMRHQSARALTTPADAPSFRAFDLNQPQGIGQQQLVSAQDWQALECEPDLLPPARGPMVLGVDLSAGYAMSAAVAYWPETQRMEGLCAFPAEPGLKARGDADGVGSLYERMASRGELMVTNGRTVNVAEFLHSAFSRFDAPTVVVCDYWRLNELKDGLDGAGIPPGIVITRRMGWKDGSEDVRNFQRAVKESRVRTPVSLAIRSAMSGAVTISDAVGNLMLAKGTQGGRRGRHKDDLAAAAVLAVSIGMRYSPGQRDSGREYKRVTT